MHMNRTLIARLLARPCDSVHDHAPENHLLHPHGVQSYSAARHHANDRASALLQRLPHRVQECVRGPRRRGCENDHQHLQILTNSRNTKQPGASSGQVRKLPFHSLVT